MWSKPFLFVFFMLLTSAGIIAQSNGKIQTREYTGKNQLLSAGIFFPLGDFAKSHVTGAGVEYGYSKNRFGLLSKKPGKEIGFIFTGGAAYYFGKNDKTSSAPGFKFKNLTYLHASAGAIYNPSDKTNICLTTGPAAEIYAGNTSIGFIVNLCSSYFVNKKVGITPAISYIKQSEAGPLWVAALKASIILDK